MRINIILGHQLAFPPIEGGGVNNLMQLLAPEFANRGHTVTVYSPTHPELPQNETDSHGIRHIRCKGAAMVLNPWSNNLRGLPYALRVYRQLQPADVTMFHMPYSFLLRRKPGIGICTHTIHRTPKWFTGIYASLDRVYVASHAVAGVAGNRSAAVGRIIKVVPNCLPRSVLAPSPDNKTTNGPLRLVFIGRFSPDKGLESLIRGTIKVARSGTDIRLRTIGPLEEHGGSDLSFLNRMQTLIKHSGYNEKISITGPIYDTNQLLQELAGHDVYCLPSLAGETLNMSAIEAMSVGLPILGSSFAPVAELIEHGKNGRIASAGNPDAWAKEINWLTNHRTELQAMGQAAKIYAENHFSLAQVATTYLEDFAEMMRA